MYYTFCGNNLIYRGARVTETLANYDEATLTNFFNSIRGQIGIFINTQKLKKLKIKTWMFFS